MKKLLARILRFLLKKVEKSIHRKYKIDEEELKGRECCIQVPEIKELTEEQKKIVNIYVYHESIFSVNIKNIPSRLIQDYCFVDNDKIKLEIILGGENDLDVYEELEKKKCSNIFEENMEKENMEIEIFSHIGFNKKIILKNIKVMKVNAFEHGNSKSKEVYKANVLIKYDSKYIERF
jgi:hypothetical protein